MRNWILRQGEPTLRWQIGDVKITKVSECVLEGGLDVASANESFLGIATREALLSIGWMTPDFVTERGYRICIDGLTLKDSGRFLDNDGKDHPW